MIRIPSLIIAASLAHFDITYTFQDSMSYTWVCLWNTQVITFVLLLMVVMLRALIPDLKASKINPIEIPNKE